MYDKVLELLMELNATEEQFDAPVVYGSGRDGYMMYHLGEEKKDMSPLFQTILDHIPPPFAKPNEPFHMLVSNIDWSDYVGRIAVGKILGGSPGRKMPVYARRRSTRRRMTSMRQRNHVRLHRQREALDQAVFDSSRAVFARVEVKGFDEKNGTGEFAVRAQPGCHR